MNTRPLLKIMGVASMALLTGCAETEIRLLEEMPHEGSRFSLELAREYEHLAKRELYQFYDEADAAYFAQKGQMVASGTGVVLPEHAENWDVLEQDRPLLNHERTRLMHVLECGREKAPRIAAKAQRYYDEWLEQLEEHWQKKEITYARTLFYGSLRQLENVCGLSQKKHISHQVLPFYVVTFDLNKDFLDAQAHAILKKVAAEAKQKKYVTIELHGHTDACGRKLHNEALSKKRADHVKNALIREGVPAQSVRAFGEGVASHSKKFERKNRNVVIVLNANK